MRFVKTDPQREGYFWIRDDNDFYVIAWFFDGLISTPHADGYDKWSKFVAQGWKRSAKEVTPC
jgi:hypothetical protein